MARSPACPHAMVAVALVASLAGGCAAKAGPPARAVWEDAKLRGVDFRALGNEPGWYVEIDDGARITLVTDYGETRVETPAPVPDVGPRASRTTYAVQTEAHDLIITIEGRACQDNMSGEAFPSTVVVTLDGRRYQGCGRALH